MTLFRGNRVGKHNEQISSVRTRGALPCLAAAPSHAPLLPARLLFLVRLIWDKVRLERLINSTTATDSRVMGKALPCISKQ